MLMSLLSLEEEALDEKVVVVEQVAFEISSRQRS
jgi:hypothetical protein